MLSVLREKGYYVEGCDLSRRFADLAKLFHDIDVVVDDFLQIKSKEKFYDAIILLGTISNISNLGDSLRKIHRELVPGGILYFNLPVADSFLVRVYGRNYWMFTPAAANFMSRDGCRAALHNAGFKLERMFMDYQQPSWDKLLSQSGFKGIQSMLLSCGLGSRSIPLSIPLPGIYTVIARN